MKALIYATIVLVIFAGSNSFARSPHDTDSSIGLEITEGKIIAAESQKLTSEVIRLTKKLESTLESVNIDIEMDYNEGRIIGMLVDLIEEGLTNVKAEIKSLDTNKSSNSIYSSLKDIEENIDMI